MKFEESLYAYLQINNKLTWLSKLPIEYRKVMFDR